MNLLTQAQIDIKLNNLRDDKYVKKKPRKKEHNSTEKFSKKDLNYIEKESEGIVLLYNI